MANQFGKQMANREVCDMVFVDYKTKEPFLFCDYANTSSQELTGENVFAYGGKGHPKKITFSGERAGTLTIETQIQTPKLWELMTGGKSSKTAEIMKRVKVKVGKSNKVSITDTKVTLTKENVWVYDGADSNMETKLGVTTVSGQDITLKDSKAEGTEVVVFYLATRNDVYNISIRSTDFPKAFTVYGDTYMKTTDEDVLPYLFKAYKVVPQANMSLSFASSGDPGTVTLTCDMMVDDDGNMLDLTLLPDEDEPGGIEPPEDLALIGRGKIGKAKVGKSE